MRSLIILREETSALTGLSSIDTPFSLRKTGGSEPPAVQLSGICSGLCSSQAFAVLLKDMDNARQVIGDDVRYVIFPETKGDAPLIALSALHFSDETLLIIPAWVKIEAEEMFKDCIKKAQTLADMDKIAVSGGIICAKSSVILSELKKYSAELSETAEKVYESRRECTSTVRFCGLFMERFNEATITDALLCKSDRAVYMPETFGVRYMDSYDSIYEANRKDKNGNVSLNLDGAYGVAEYAGARDNLVMTADRDITLAGVEGLIVVDTGKKLLIAKRGSDIEKLLKESDA